MNTKSLLKYVSYFTIMTASLMLSLVSCKKDKGEEKKPEPLALEITVTPEATSMTATIAASDESLGYYVSYILESEYTYDSKLIERDKAALEAKASDEGISLEEAVEQSLKYGNQTVTFENLEPGVKYIVYAYQLDKAFQNGDVFKSTSETEPEYMIEIREIAASAATVVVKPAETKSVFFLNIVPKEDVDSYATEEEFMTAHIAEMKPLIKYMIHNESELDENGDFVLRWEKLYPETEYYAVVFGYDAEKGVNTTSLYKSSFNTPEFSDAFTIELVINQLTSVSAGGYTKPSNSMYPYARGIMTKSSFEREGADLTLVQEQLDSIINARMDKNGQTREEVIKNLTLTGNTPFSFTQLTENTEYVVWAAVINENANILMEPTTATFTTTESTHADGSIQLEYTTHYDGDDYYEDNPLYGYNYKDKFVMQVKIHSKTDDIVNWRLRICGGDLSDKSEEELLGIVMGGRKNPSYDKQIFLYEKWSLATENGDKCTVLLVGLDEEDRPTDIVKIVKDIRKDNASPIEQFYEESGAKH